jgi:cytochrome c biogenesis protein
VEPDLAQKSKTSTGMRFYAWAFDVFASLKLTLVVLLVLAFALFVGMFWDQTLALDEHLAKISTNSWWADLFVFFELNDVFHSWWFGVVVLVLALNLIACSIERLPKIWVDIHNPERVLTDRLLKRLPQKYQVTTSEEIASSVVARELGANCYHAEQGADSYFYFERHKYGRCGVYIVHIALLMIMFGSIVTTSSGLDGMMMISEGEAERNVRVKGPGGLPFRHDLAFDVVCTDFRLKTYVDGSPMEFESDLAIFDKTSPQNPVASQTIRVNTPLQYAGYTFYQSSYQALEGEQRVRLAIGPHGGERKVQVVSIGTRIELSDKSVLVPIEIIDEYGGLGAALKMQQISPKGEATEFVVFRQYPDFDPLVRRGEWDVLFQGFDQQYATGVSVGRVPYINVVFAGFVVMFFGLYMAFCMSHRRYYARIRKREDGTCELTMAGIARRHLYAFGDEFAKLVERLNAEVKHE